MNILFLTPQLPYPPRQGTTIRNYNLLVHLARQHTIDLLTFLAPGEQLDLRRLPFRLRAILYLTGRTIRWQTIQMMLDAGYVDGYRRLHPDDPGHTFPIWDPHIRLDYAFFPASCIDRLKESSVVSQPVAAVGSASDHLPLLLELDA